MNKEMEELIIFGPTKSYTLEENKFDRVCDANFEVEAAIMMGSICGKECTKLLTFNILDLCKSHSQVDHACQELTKILILVSFSIQTVVG